MEPLAIVSLVGNIVQFIDVLGRIANTAKEIHQSKSGRTAKITILQNKAHLAQDLSNRIGAFTSGTFSNNQQHLLALAQLCVKDSEQMLDLTARIETTGAKSILGSWRAAWRTHRLDEPAKELESRMNHSLTQLQLQYGQVAR